MLIITCLLLGLGLLLDKSLLILVFFLPYTIGVRSSIPSDLIHLSR